MSSVPTADAVLDRVARADGGERVQADPRLAQIRKGIEILSGGGMDRAEKIQMLFSDPYVPDWNRRDKSGKNGAGRH